MSAWSVRLAGAAKREDAERSGLVSESRTFVIEDSLGYLVNRMARLMAHELGERIRPAGVAIGQWAVLLFLWARDGMTQAELSRGGGDRAADRGPDHRPDGPRRTRHPCP